MNSAWSTICTQTQSSHSRFLHSCANIRDSQTEQLRKIISRNANSRYGQSCGFLGLSSSSALIDRFQQQVPIHGYDDIEPLMRQQMAGIEALICDEVHFYECTGGSSGGAKYVPYTEHSLVQLQAAVEPWLCDLIQHRPAIADGPAYWSDSPAVKSEGNTDDGTQIGASSDLAFMRSELQMPFAQTLVDMSAIQLAQDYEQWQKFTLLTLVMHDKLRLFSVWSPAFLNALLESFDKHKTWLLDALQDPIDQELSACGFLSDATLNRRASDRLIEALSKSENSQELLAKILWPDLDTISCWTHGPANGAVVELRRWFPATHIQPKGLLATEGVVSIPLHAASYPVLAVNSGFFEFVDEDGVVHLPESLRQNECYRVLFSNASGLYRYDIGDQVCMRGFYKQAPMLEFIGRRNSTSDLVGEKLHDSFVSRCLESLQGTSLLAPRDGYYCLYIDSCLGDRLDLTEIAMDIDERLCANPQYRYARQLSQLSPIKVSLVQDMATEQLMWQQRNGRVLGDIKPTALCTDTGLIAYLEKQSR